VLRCSEHPDSPRAPTQAEECARWLLEAMERAGTPVKPKEMIRQAEEHATLPPAAFGLRRRASHGAFPQGTVGTRQRTRT
jgi:hypothetical protein